MTVVDDLIEEFADLDEREANQLLDELGRGLPKIPESVYSKENLIPGCQSRVWMVKSLSDEQPATLKIHADSDAIIVKGLVYLLSEIYQGLTPEEVLAVDYVQIFEDLNLSRLITPQRKNGLFSMVKSIRDFAAASIGTKVQPIPIAAPTSIHVAATRSIDSIASEFPILCTPLPDGNRPVFLDSGASAQKPQSVIDKEREVQESYYANAFRGRYYFGQRIDEEIEKTRALVASFIGARRVDEIVFTSGTTMSLNMVASAWGRKFLSADDEIVITEMEHHANFVPWQAIANERGAKVRIIPVTPDGRLDLDEAAKLIGPKTQLVALCTMSNVLGTVNPVSEICELAHRHNAVVCVDAAQSVPHLPINVSQLEVDFLTFSGHKLYGPSGVGVLYGRLDLLQSMDPFLYGGHMIQSVGRTDSSWSEPPAKFEAGTMPIVQIISLGAAVEFVLSVGLDAIAAHEHALLVAAHDELSTIEGLTIYGPSVDMKGAIVSFSIEGVSTEDLSHRLDAKGIFTRHGHHCAMVLHDTLGVPATTRASFGMYNTLDEVDYLAKCVKEAVAELKG